MRIKQIPGFPDYYATSLGDILSLKTSGTRPRFLKGSIASNGYRMVKLRKNGKTQTKTVHYLIALTFLDKPKSNKKLVIDHIDKSKLNNKISNLRWLPHGENILRTPLKEKRRDPNFLSDADVWTIRWYREAYPHYSYVKIAKLLGIRSDRVSDLLRGKTYKFVK